MNYFKGINIRKKFLVKRDETQKNVIIAPTARGRSLGYDWQLLDCNPDDIFPAAIIKAPLFEPYSFVIYHKNAIWYACEVDFVKIK